MAVPLQLAQSRTYPVPVGDAFAGTMPMPLDRLFSRRFGPIPPITHTTQEGVWSTVGQVRTVHTADGGSLREQLTVVDPPRRFGYELSEVTGPMKPLVERVEGVWTFDVVGSGCRITWAWTVHPNGALGRLAMPVFARFWKGYAKRSLDRLEGLLLAI
jgi:hypothetical protein